MNKCAPQKIADDDPRQDVLRRRCRDLGLRPTHENLIAAAKQMAGAPAGRAFILGMDPDTAQRAWQAWCGLLSSEDRYFREVHGLSMSPSSANMVTEPEPFEANADDDIDLRSEDERERDARNSWADWSGYLACMDIADQAIMQAVKRGWAHPVKDGKLTDKGRAFCAAMVAFVEVVER